MHVPEVPSDIVADWALIPQKVGLHGKADPSPGSFWWAWSPCGEWFGQLKCPTTARPTVGSPCLLWGWGLAGFSFSSLTCFLDVPPTEFFLWL